MEREFEYEKEKPVKKGGVLGKILMLLLGILLGIVLTVGSVVGVGYWLTQQPLKKTVQLADKYIEGDLYATIFGEEQDDGTRTNGLLNADYANKKIADFIESLSDSVSDLSKTSTIQDLCEISPKLEDWLEDFLEKTSDYAITFDKETVLSTPFKSLGSYVENVIKSSPVGDIISALDEDLPSLMLALCYGEEGVDYTYDENGDVVMLGDSKKTTFNDLITGDLEAIFNKIPVASIIDVSVTDTTMMAIAYGPSNRYVVNGDTVTMTQVAYTYENGSFFNDKDELVAATAVALGNGVSKLTFADGAVEYVKANSEASVLVYKDEACTEPVLYKKTMVGDLQKDSMAIIDSICLKDALNIDASAHKVLISLAYGEEGVNYKIVGEGENARIELINDSAPRTIGQLRQKGGDLINEIPLADIVDDDGTSLTRYLLYGKQGVHYTVDGGKVIMLQRRIAILGDRIYNEYGEVISGVISGTTYTDSKGVSYQYVNSGLGTIKTANGDAQLYYLNDMDGNAVFYSKTSLGALAGSNDLIANLTSRLTVSEVMDEALIAGNKFLKHVKDTVIEDLPNAIEELTIQQVFEDEIFDGAGVVKGEWWYMLHNETDCRSAGHSDPHVCTCVSDYGLKEMDTLIDNMKNNIHLSTLDKLAADGMLAFGPDMLNSDVITDITILTQPFHVKVRVPDGNGNWIEKNASEVFVDENGVKKSRIGLLTVEETIQYAEGLINLLAQVEAYF